MSADAAASIANISNGVTSLSTAASNIYNTFGYKAPKQPGSRISLGSSGIGGLSAGGGGYNAPSNPRIDVSAFSQGSDGPSAPRMSSGPQQQQSGFPDHYSMLLKILNVPRG